MLKNDDDGTNFFVSSQAKRGQLERELGGSLASSLSEEFNGGRGRGRSNLAYFVLWADTASGRTRELGVHSNNR